MKLMGWALAAALALVAMIPATAQDEDKEIVIDWDHGVLYALEDGELIHHPIITNTGIRFKERYLGTFRISQKLLAHRSSMYNEHVKPRQPGELGAMMRYWMRLGSSAQGLHFSPAWSPDGDRHRSMGCYRLSRADAEFLFEWAPIGTPIHVVRHVCDSRWASLAPAQCERPATHEAKANGRRPAAHGARNTNRRRPVAHGARNTDRRPVAREAMTTGRRPKVVEQ